MTYAVCELCGTRAPNLEAHMERTHNAVDAIEQAALAERVAEAAAELLRWWDGAPAVEALRAAVREWRGR